MSQAPALPAMPETFMRDCEGVSGFTFVTVIWERFNSHHERVVSHRATCFVNQSGEAWTPPWVRDKEETTSMRIE